LQAPPSGMLGRFTLRFEGWERDGEVLGTDPELVVTVSEATTLTAVYQVEGATPSGVQETDGGQGGLFNDDTPVKPGIPGTPVKPGTSSTPGTPVQPGTQVNPG